MTGKLEQPSSNVEQSIESSDKHISIQSPLESLPASTKVEQPELKMQGDKIEVPPITVAGWNDRTAGNTNANFIELSNPYQSLSLEVAGRRWTDLGAGQTGDTGPVLAQAAPPPRADDRTLGAPPYDGGQDPQYNLGDGQGPAVLKYSENTVEAANFIPQFVEAARGAFNILSNAVEGVGKALWALTSFRNSVNNGRLGCAASVSEVLQRSGYNYANSAGVGGLEGQLMKNGWRKAPLSEASPEDVVMIGRSPGWRAGGGNAHVGIVGENGSVYHNSSSRGQWIKDNLQARFGRGGEMFVLKPPSEGRKAIDPRMFCNPEPAAEITPRQQYWTGGYRSQPTDQNTRRASDDRRSTGYGDDNSSYRSQDRFQRRYSDADRDQPLPRYDQRDQGPQTDPQYAENDMPPGRNRTGDNRGWQQRMMDRVRRQFRS